MEKHFSSGFELADLLEPTSIELTPKAPSEIIIEELSFGEDTESPVTEESATPVKDDKDDCIMRNGKKLLKTGTAYVYKLADGGGFVYRLLCKSPKIDKWVMTNPDAKTDPVTGAGIRPRPFKTAAEAEKHRFAALLALEEKNSDEIRQRTFEEVWRTFEDSAHDKAAETIRRYNSIYKNHVKSEFGDRIISSIAPGEYNDFLARKYRQATSTGEGLSYSYVKSILKFFYLVVTFARANNNISREAYIDFDQFLKMPSKKKAKDDLKIRILTDEQIQKIAELLKDTDYYLPFLISLLCGLRPAETFALTFDDIDAKTGLISINKQVVVETDGLRCIKPPKTIKSTRKVAYPKIILDEVKKRKERCMACDPRVFENNKKMFVDMRSSVDGVNIIQPDFINVDRLGKFIEPHSFSYYTKIIKRDICPPEDGVEEFSFYTFRKTNLSHICSRLSLHAAMLHAGHSKPDTLMKYYIASTPQVEKMELEVAENIAAAFSDKH